MKNKNSTWKQSDQFSSDAYWSGTAMIYAANGKESFALSGDYSITYENESEPEDLRAARLFKAHRGQPVSEVAFDKLGKEVVVVFGSKITSAKAVATLRALIARIEDEGLIVGRVGTGNFVHEPVDRQLIIDDASIFDLDEDE